MKRLWFSVLFLAIAIGTCTYEQAIVKNAYKDITAVIDAALISEDPYEKIEYCKDITEKWDKHFKKISLVTDHSILQSADVSVGTINSLAKKGGDSVDEALIQTKSELEQIYDSSKINLSNIF